VGSVPIDTTPAIDINQKGTIDRSLPTVPSVKQLDSIGRKVMADATTRTQNALQLLQATSAERVTSRSVQLQPTSVWVPKLNQQVNNGYTASNTITFRIPSSALGSLLVDLLAVGVTNIDRCVGSDAGSSLNCYSCADWLLHVLIGFFPVIHWYVCAKCDQHSNGG
jgi:hypothetical protein